MALAAYPGGFPITEEQLETSGALVYMAMLAGPSGAGILLTGLLDGRAGFRNLLFRLIKWRVSLHWYAVALLTAPLLISMILLGLSLFSAEFQPTIFTSAVEPVVILSAVVVGLVVDCRCRNGNFQRLAHSAIFPEASGIKTLKTNHSMRLSNDRFLMSQGEKS